LVGNIQVFRQLFLGDAVLLAEALDLFTDGHRNNLSFVYFVATRLLYTIFEIYAITARATGTQPWVA
jgi:hypothetical protein